MGLSASIGTNMLPGSAESPDADASRTISEPTPTSLKSRLTSATMEALADPAVRQRLSDLGQEIPPPEQQTAAALAAHLASELEKWTPIIKDAGIKVE